MSFHESLLINFTFSPSLKKEITHKYCNLILITLKTNEGFYPQNTQLVYLICF